MTRARVFPYESGFTADWRGWPPHMVPAERELLYWWLNQPAMKIAEIWYDVPLDGEDPERAKYPGAAEILNPTELRTWYALTARRADAIVRTNNGYYVLEIRDRADAQTLGEIIIYNQLAKDQWSSLTWEPPRVLARSWTAGVLQNLRLAGIMPIPAPENLYDPAELETRYTPTPPPQILKTG